MADEIKPNGDEETGEERLTRIERALNLMLDDLDKLRGAVQGLVTEFREFGRHVETMRENFDQRLKRLES